MAKGLGLINELVPSVITSTGVTFRVLVRHSGSESIEDSLGLGLGLGFGMMVRVWVWVRVGVRDDG